MALPAQSAEETSAQPAGALELVLQRFSQRAELVELCHARLAAFREICEDYHEVHQALSRHKASGVDSSDNTDEEMRVLLAELEAEIERALEQRVLLRTSESPSSECDG
jgi:hypothetical protein